MHTDEDQSSNLCASVPHLWQLIYAAGFSPLSRFASQSREFVWPLASVSIFPLIVSPSSLPLYLETTVLPLRSRFTVNASTPSLKLASSILVSWLLRPRIAPSGLPSLLVSFR